MYIPCEASSWTLLHQNRKLSSRISLQNRLFCLCRLPVVRIQSLNLISHFLQIQYNSEKNVKFLFTNKQNSGASETFWIKWMYQLEDISCPQLYPRACICLMMCFKYNWNAGLFFYFMDFLEEKKTYIFNHYIFCAVNLKYWNT